jgi:hypothetical protein
MGNTERKSLAAEFTGEGQYLIPFAHIFCKGKDIHKFRKT